MQEAQLMFVRKLLQGKPYSVQRQINEGTYGQVYEVVHSSTRKSYAMKLMELSQIKKANKMHEIQVETNLMSTLKHPGIVKLQQVVRWPQHVGLVMELGQFGDLFSLINWVHSKVELQSKIHKLMRVYLAQALEVIDYLHSQGIVHRDLKPENFVICSDLKLKLIDFGTCLITPTSPLFAKNILLPQSPLGPGLVGSANYLSPESLQLNYTAKSDIWSFGILVYKFFYNQLPFQGSNNVEIFNQLVESQVCLEKADPQIQQLIVLCLKRDPIQRASAKMLKMCTMFKGINFKQVFQLDPPLYKHQLPVKEAPPGVKSQFLFQQEVGKKMFFGNFKPRLLTITKDEQGLLLAYRYLPTKTIKRQLRLSLNDYAQYRKDGQFEVVANNKRFVFRVSQGKSAEEAAFRINDTIKKGYNLQ